MSDLAETDPLWLVAGCAHVGDAPMAAARAIRNRNGTLKQGGMQRSVSFARHSFMSVMPFTDTIKQSGQLPSRRFCDKATGLISQLRNGRVQKL